MKYRTDIDGLRAIAVLGVVAVHAKMSFAPSGFLGVDIFFVISGYLISQMVYDEIRDGRFSFCGFYDRRLRRIFPALAVMLFVTVPFACFYLPPPKMESYIKSLLAAVMGVSNLYFFSESDGQLNTLTGVRPLLHTWSLGVEEQFYLAFPALFALGYRRARYSLNTWIIAIGCLAFFATLLCAFYFPLVWFHTWEFLLGAAVALGIVPSIRDSITRNAAAAAGLFLIIGSMLMTASFQAGTVLLAFTASVGAGLIIVAGIAGPTLTGRLLASPPLVFVGLISYSLYLWHYPITVFHRVGFLPYFSDVSLIAISLVIATLSWLFIEKPFRAKHRW